MDDEVADNPESSRWGVFLSHTYELSVHPSNGSFIAAARRAVERAGHATIEMDMWTAANLPAADLCTEKLKACDVYVAIIGFRYGSLVGEEPSRSYTEFEFETAGTLGLPRFIFLTAEHLTVPVPREFYHDPQYANRQDDFRRRIGEVGLTPVVIRSPEQLETLLFQALIEHSERRRQHLYSTPRRRPSAYLQQVARIVPTSANGTLGLLGREGEVAELSAFCIGSDHSPYTWWRAPAWAGKSALMATFVRHPPDSLRDRVQIVSFFITARLASQDTREAFVTALLDQLADLTGQDAAPSLTEAQREAFLLDLLAHAAENCRNAGRRLVLVVDGLDEDRGVTTGPNAHSIAGLLPAAPPAGMRVVVAGRPNPPIPDDVPDWHPLRDPRIVRPLAPSPHAADLRRLSQTELKRLLKGTPLERDLLGFLVAARGGLSGPDLNDLTDAVLWEIEEILHTVAGRTFTRRVANWQPGSRPEVYLLGHEELQVAAAGYLGEVALASYQRRLHSWAEIYIARGWPVETPEYLLSGYYRLLSATGNLTRMVALATDTARHDRMLDITGGDAAQLTEIRNALDLMAQQDTPDLIAAFRLAYHRDQLADRNSNIPTELPATWASLGRLPRADALARSIADLYRQAAALTGVAQVLIATGQHVEAATACEEASRVAGTIGNPSRQADALTRLMRVLAADGQHAQASIVACTITDPSRKAEALAELVEALVAAGQHEQASEVALAIPDSVGQAYGLTRVAEALVEAGQHNHAAIVAHQAAGAALTIADPRRAAYALAMVTRVLAHAGRFEQAFTVAQSVAPSWQADAFIALVSALAAGGEHGQASIVANTITDTYRRAQALNTVTQALAADGQYDRAIVLARTITDVSQRAGALAGVAVASVRAGQGNGSSAVANEAATVAYTIADPSRQTYVLTEVIQALCAADQLDQALTVVDRAITVANTIARPSRRADALTGVARALAQAGHLDHATNLANHATTVAHTIAHPSRQMGALVAVAQMLEHPTNPHQHRSDDRAGTLGHPITIPSRIPKPSLSSGNHSDRGLICSVSVVASGL